MKAHPWEDEPMEPNPEVKSRVDLFAPYTSAEARAEFELAGDAVSTGFAPLDDEEFVLRPGKLYAVIARPSEGKTTLLLELAMRRVELIAAGTAPPGGPVVFCTYEEMRREIYLKLLLREAGRSVDPGARVGRKTAEAWLLGDSQVYRAEWLEAAAKVLDGHAAAGRLAIVDGDHGDGLDVEELTDDLRATQAELGKPPSLLVVDYYQKITPPRAARQEPRYIQLQAVADTLRRYAKPDDPRWAVPVVTGAQVTRSPEKLSDTPPDLTGIREADDLANDAAGVLSLALEKSPEKHAPYRKLKVRIVKNRDGRRDHEFSLRLHGPCSMIDEEPEGPAQSSASLGNLK